MESSVTSLQMGIFFKRKLSSGAITHMVDCIQVDLLLVAGRKRNSSPLQQQGDASSSPFLSGQGLLLSQVARHVKGRLIATVFLVRIASQVVEKSPGILSKFLVLTFNDE
jgi:hypothetical protein